jgi:hypothetical protein
LDATPEIELFTSFRALPEPRIPGPGQPVVLALEWPDGARVRSLRVRVQTSVAGPWSEVPQRVNGDAPQTASLGVFDRATPVSYRVDAQLEDGATAELWGYFQVREEPERSPLPYALSPDLIPQATAPSEQPQPASLEPLPEQEVDLLKIVDPTTCWKAGEWVAVNGELLSPKRYGARIEIPYSPPEQYRMLLIVEPLDEPDGLLLGLRLGDKRFATLFHYTPQEEARSAIENVDGRNVGNETTFTGNVFRKDRLSQVLVTVTNRRISATVDGRTILDWQGTPDQLSLSDYWRTPNPEALFLGAYDCRYRFHRISLEPITGRGRRLTRDSAN